MAAHAARNCIKVTAAVGYVGGPDGRTLYTFDTVDEIGAGVDISSAAGLFAPIRPSDTASTPLRPLLKTQPREHRVFLYQLVAYLAAGPHGRMT